MFGLRLACSFILSETTLSAFSCPQKSITMEPRGHAAVELHFLPFHMGPRHCTVVFVNDDVGEFLYAVDANALPPQASNLPFNSGGTRMSSAAATGL